MSLIKDLKKQLLNEDANAKKDAQDCLTIANKLQELEDGHIWSSKWQVLVNENYVGNYPHGEAYYYPSEIGKIFLKGLLH